MIHYISPEGVTRFVSRGSVWDIGFFWDIAIYICVYTYIYGHVPFKRGPLESQSQRVHHSMIGLVPFKGPPWALQGSGPGPFKGPPGPSQGPGPGPF